MVKSDNLTICRAAYLQGQQVQYTGAHEEEWHEFVCRMRFSKKKKPNFHKYQEQALARIMQDSLNKSYILA